MDGIKLLSVALVLAVARASVQHTSPRSDDWHPSARTVPDAHVLKLRIKARQSNIDELHRIAHAVSDPRNSKYGQYLSSAALAALTAPAEEDVTSIVEWLRRANIPYKFASSHILEATGTAKVLSDALQTSFQYHVSRITGETIVRAGDFSLPTHVDAAIGAIYGLHGFPLPPRKPTSLDRDASPKTVIPADIIKAYGISGVTPSGSAKNRQAVAQFEGTATLNNADLKEFFSKFVPSAPSSAASVHKCVPNEGVATGPGDLESSLDIEYIMGLAPGLNSEFWFYGQTGGICDNFALWSDALVSQDDIPLVHSVSYGAYESALQWVCPQAHMQDVELNLAKLATKGISILFASGDSGAGYMNIGGDVTLSNAWPASSPWVTAVGATQFQNQIPGPEIAPTQFGSGGGFSRYRNVSKEFDYQASAVKTYLSTASDLPPKAHYSAGGRATPDVSSVGQDIQIVAGGAQATLGTSASAPEFAAVVSLLNEARLNAGKPSMGFLNPFLYQNPGAFTDITVGSNKFDRGGAPQAEGFSCAKGWDPVTGLGTPIFGKLKDAALAAVGLKAVIV
jgi:tripeptidyl-peptidase-1